VDGLEVEHDVTVTPLGRRRDTRAILPCAAGEVAAGLERRVVTPGGAEDGIVRDGDRAELGGTSAESRAEFP
jgi:hypothetical protein